MLLVMRPRAILGVLILGALALRLVALGETLSHDEGYTWLVASAHGPSVFYDRLSAFLDHAMNEGFLRPEHRSRLLVAPDTEALLAAWT